MIKKDKGVTLVALTIAVIIILTITGMIVYSAKDSVYVKNLTNMRNDISNLRDKVSLYYSEYGEIPAETEYPNISNLQSAGVIGANDTGKFLIIELENLDGLTLNYGKDYEKYKANDYTNLTDLTDIYIINENSHNIFYVQGVSVKENDGTKMYYTDYTKGDQEEVALQKIGKVDGSYDEEKGVNTPKINEEKGMQLVKYDEATQTWIEDTIKLEYNYIAQTGTTENGGTSKWANAKVTIDGVESYFVWIPRYAYKINSGNETIDVKFIKDTGTEATDGTICKYADDPTLNTSTDYIIHPAFTTNADLGGGWSTELPGLWIGKYEAARSDAGITADDMGNSETIQIKPGVTSWRSTTIGDMYTYAFNYARNLESHMLKNSEWGAVAYLTHSQYGRNGTEVTINNNSNCLTGNAGDSVSASLSTTTNAYNTEKGVLASSTGNVYGIYDLSGGAWEYAAGYYAKSSNLTAGSSFADGTNDEYATAYTGTTAESNYKYGDATYETSGWNNDLFSFFSATYPFIERGGYCGRGSDAGVFSLAFMQGDTHDARGFRVCLAVQ